MSTPLVEEDLRIWATQDCLKKPAEGIPGVTAQRIGEWDFDPQSGELTRGRDRRRLEPRAAKTLEMLCEAQISDRALVTMGHPGGGGFEDEPYFIEGRAIDLRPGPPAHPMIKATFDLTPGRFYETNPFGAFS